MKLGGNMQEYKLILVSDNTGKSRVRYLKKGDRHWNTIYLNESDIDVIVDKLIESIKDV